MCAHSTTGEDAGRAIRARGALLYQGACLAFDPSEATLRRASLDCLVSYRGSRYSVPYMAAREFVAIKKDADGAIHIFFEGERIASHRRAHKGETVIVPSHYQGIALSHAPQPKPLQVHGLKSAPVVEERDLSVYEGVLV